MIQVKATREGLVGQITSTGWIIDVVTPFVALPSTVARNLWVYVVNPANGRGMRAQVKDTGPWNTVDNPYVFQAATQDDAVLPVNEIVRPQAESGLDMFGRETNGAGIDLGEAVHQALGLADDNGEVQWWFVEEENEEFVGEDVEATSTASSFETDLIDASI